MPPILNPNTSGTGINLGLTGDVRNTDFQYQYPQGLKLRPGTKLHDRLVDLVMRYARDSYTRMSSRHRDWREVDRVLKAYTYLPPTGGPRKSEDENAKGAIGKNDTMRRIVMPVSYVVLETLLTYFTSAFIRDPIYDLVGTGPEDILKGMLSTQVLQQQLHRSGAPLAYHTAYRDMFSYGVGYASPRWHVERGRTMEVRPEGYLDPLRRLFNQTGSRSQEGEFRILHEGNAIDNIDPYLALPDPNVAAHEVQDGEFFGWIEETNLSKFLRSEGDPDAGLFNGKYLKLLQQGTLTSSIRNQGERGSRQNNPMQVTHPADVIWMYVDLIPKDWGLGKGKNFETWTFGVAADKILVRAEPLNLIHGKIPVACGAPDFDGYSSAPISRLLAIEELQVAVDFLYTSHIENIKRVINDNLVVDPSLINIHDVNSNRPGKVIRALKRAWGQGNLKDNAIFQLDVRDATQGNVFEAQFLMEQAKMATSTMDQLGGTLAPRTSRISASEAQSTRMSGLTRLERPAQMVSYQFMLPLARMMVSNMQQYMSQDVYIQTVGDLEQSLRTDFGVNSQRGRVKVSPLDVIAEYDIQAHDGAVPGREDVSAWLELYQIMGQNPELAKNFDMTRIFKHIAREMGAKNVDSFVRVVPDEEVLREQEAGNIVPLEVGGDGAAFA